MKQYVVIGSPGQVAAIDFKCSLVKAYKCCRTARFSNDLPALIACNFQFERKRDAIQLVKQQGQQ